MFGLVLFGLDRKVQEAGSDQAKNMGSWEAGFSKWFTLYIFTKYLFLKSNRFVISKSA